MAIDLNNINEWARALLLIVILTAIGLAVGFMLSLFT